jgi:hypothetical protein
MQVMVEAHDMPERVSTLLGTTRLAQVSPPFRVPMMTAASFGPTPIALQDLAVAQEMLERLWAFAGTI